MKPNKELTPPYFMADVTHRISLELNRKLENNIIEGLKRKGFEFKTRIELGNFLKTNCRCEDNVEVKERVYFVNDIPFFLHRYKANSESKLINDDGSIKMSASCGYFGYL